MHFFPFKRTLELTRTTDMKKACCQFLLLLLTAACITMPIKAIMVNYDYSKTIDFPRGLEVGKLMDQIRANPGILKTLMGTNMIDNVVSILFDANLMSSEMIALDAVILAHTPDTLLEQFCVELPDADSTITSAMVRVGLMIANSTVTRTYTMMTATQMLLDGESRGSFYFVNTGSATATVAVVAGMKSKGSLSVAAGGNGHFMYSLTNVRKGSEMYILVSC